MLRVNGGLRRLVLALVATLAVASGLVAGGSTARAADVDVRTGIIGGAAFKIEVPPNWNGTLVLYSHGYVPPGSPNPARDVGDPLTGGFLLANGYALAGSSYSGTGWAIEDAFRDQIALLDFFDGQFGHPRRTIAWGHSLGGIITAGLVQRNPGRFAGALPMCGVLAGAVGTWNQALDSAFAFKTLLARGSTLELVGITNPGANLQQALQLLLAAQATLGGRARLALVAALGDIPGWFDPTSPEPARDDFTTQQLNQFLWSRFVGFPFLFAFRAELELRARGNPSWNTRVNYRRQLERSIGRDQVEALYEQAGMDLEADLATLEGAPRIAADPRAVGYLTTNIIFDGDLRGVPVLAMHTSGDGLVVVQNEQAYARVVDAADSGDLLRQLFVHRAGHCTFSPAETITAFQTLVRRTDAGTWPETDAPDILNAQAAGLGPSFNIIAPRVPVAPAFFDVEPSRFLRPFDARRANEEKRAA